MEKSDINQIKAFLSMLVALNAEKNLIILLYSIVSAIYWGLSILYFIREQKDYKNE